MTDKLTIAIPTYERGAILVDTIARLAGRAPIVIADQTRAHPPEIEQRLAAWRDDGTIRWLRLPAPSIPHAMNVLLQTARTELVLFLDDDIEPTAGLVEQHERAHTDPAVWAVVGQILQPGESEEHHPPAKNDLEFRFNHDRSTMVRNVMAGNLSVKRERALAIGGFDENYVGAAYRFETDFALRLDAAGGKILFQPSATLRHLQLSTGGLRAHGDHRTSTSPAHSAGDYYFALCHHDRFAAYALARLRKNVLTRFHLRHPWTIPTKLIGELRGMLLARRLAAKGPSLARESSSGAAASDESGS